MGFHYLESIFIFDNLVIIRGRLYRIHIYCILGFTCLNVSITVSCFMFVKNRCLLHCCFWSCTHISWGYLPSVDLVITSAIFVVPTGVVLESSWLFNAVSKVTMAALTPCLLRISYMASATYRRHFVPVFGKW